MEKYERYLHFSFKELVDHIQKLEDELESKKEEIKELIIENVKMKMEVKLDKQK